ncbi:MAG: type II secretion system F family protein [Deltaproteobacteria bacterium]|nr:type II secretion system F family protein [Deltaproteobacteria bacterium]
MTVSDFTYRARDPRGLLIVGQAKAESREELESKLASQGLIPIQVRKRSLRLPLGDLPFRFEKAKLWDLIWNLIYRVSLEELIVFTRQLQMLVKVGMGMEEIFGILIGQTKNKKLKAALSQIQTDVQAGSSLSKALSRHPRVFNEVYVNMIMAGEEAGLLDKVLLDLTTLLMKENEIRSGVKSALLYPKIVFGALVLAIVVLMIAVVPRFAQFYATYKAELPLVTRLLIGASNFVTEYWALALLITGVGLFLFYRYKRTAKGRLTLDRLRLKLPIFGPLHLKIASSRFGHIFAALYRSGLSVTRALEVVGGTLDNHLISREILNLKSEIAIGKTLSEAMKKSPYFSTIFIETTAVGEKAGALDEMLEGLSAHDDIEIAYTIKNLTTLLEPMMLVFIFGAVAFLALSIFLPIWNLSSVVLPH